MCITHTDSDINIKSSSTDNGTYYWPEVLDQADPLAEETTGKEEFVLAR